MVYKNERTASQIGESIGNEMNDVERYPRARPGLSFYHLVLR